MEEKIVMGIKMSLKQSTEKIIKFCGRDEVEEKPGRGESRDPEEG